MTKLVVLSTPWRQCYYPSAQSLLTVLLIKCIVTVSCAPPLPDGPHGNDRPDDNSNDHLGQRSEVVVSGRRGGSSYGSRRPSTMDSRLSLLLNTSNASDSQHGDAGRTLNPDAVGIASSMKSNSGSNSATGPIDRRVLEQSSESPRDAVSFTGPLNSQVVQQNNTSLGEIHSVAKRSRANGNSNITNRNNIALTGLNLTISGWDDGHNLTSTGFLKNIHNNTSSDFNDTGLLKNSSTWTMLAAGAAEEDCMSEWTLGGSMYVIIMLSGLVCLAILFMLCSLFHKAEAFKETKSSAMEGGLLFDSKGAHLTSYDGHTAVPLL